jgi:glycosyltransferase involved in cell wall biosynthesis
MPPLSVVMPVHNAMPFLDESIGSILGQSFRDFEFVILDDGSTDGSRETLRRWAREDSRIRLVEGAARSGPAGSSNRVVRESRAPLVARMDADDISHPDRLRRQMEAFTAHPDTAVVASLWEGIDGEGRVIRSRDRSRLLRKSPFPPFTHGSAMFRRSAFDAVGGYRAQCDLWEDIDFFLRMAAQGPVLVLSEALYLHRFSPTSVRAVSRRREVEDAFASMSRCLADYRRFGTYEQLLAQPPPATRDVPLEVFVCQGSPQLWAGGSPGVLGALLRRGHLQPRLHTLAVLVWAIWATLLPRSLRAALRAYNHWRDTKAGREIGDVPLMTWTPQKGGPV